MTQTLERTPPHDLEAEQSLLGSLFLSSQAFDAEITADAFYRPAHAKIFSALQELHHASEPIDIITVANRLEANGELDNVGGKPYLFTLTNTVPTAAHAKHYAGIVRAAAVRRQLIQVGTRIVTLGYEGGDDTTALMADAQMLVMQCQDTGKQSSTLADVVRQRIEDYAKPTPRFSLPGSGVQLHYGDLNVIAARPGVGKTALALWVADALASDNEVLFLSYEMSKEELADRMVAAATGIGTETLLDGLSDADLNSVRAMCDELLSRKSFYFSECAGLKPAQLATKLRTFAARARGKAVTFIDYVQLAVEDDRNENQATSRLTKLLQQTLKATGLGNITLSQFSRGAATEDDKIRFPQLHHLRNSGSIEQDAASCGLLYAFPNPKFNDESARLIRELRDKRSWDVSPNEERTLIRLDWQKQRHGSRRVEFLYFDGKAMRFDPVKKIETVSIERLGQ